MSADKYIDHIYARFGGKTPGPARSQLTSFPQLFSSTSELSLSRLCAYNTCRAKEKSLFSAPEDVNTP